MKHQRSAWVMLAAGLLAALPATASADWNWDFFGDQSQGGLSAAIVVVSTRTETRTKTATRTRTPTRTRTATRTPTRTRTPRPPTNTPSPRPTFTETPFGYVAPTKTRTPFTGGFGSGQISMSQSSGASPAQKLPAALLVFPLVQSSTVNGVAHETRIELVNLSNRTTTVNCFYVRGSDCFEVGFFLTLTPNQPVSWLASSGFRNTQTFSSVPPFIGEGELKCGVVPSTPFLRDHNVLQGRAIVYDDQQQAISYSSVAFRRLTEGEFEGFYALDGETYENCPERLHFDVLSVQPGSNSEIVLLTCNEDLVNQIPTTTTAQFQIVSEFEQVFSASMAVTCWSKKPLDRLSGTLNYSTLGSTTAHLVVRGVQSSLIGFAIDRFEAFGLPVSTGNEPFLEGGRPGEVHFP